MGAKKCTEINFKAPLFSNFSQGSNTFPFAEGGCSSSVPYMTRHSKQTCKSQGF